MDDQNEHVHNEHKEIGHKELKKKNHWNFFSIILAVLLLIAVGYIAFDKVSSYQNNKIINVKNTSYQQGLKDENQYIVNQIISDLNSQGQTSITLPTGNNKTVTIPLIALTTIVNQLNQKGKFTFNTFDSNNKSISVDLIMPQMCTQYMAALNSQSSSTT